MGFFSDWAAKRDANVERLKHLPQRYSQYDIVMAWEIRASGPETIISGVIKNVRFAYLDGLEVWVAALDDSGKTGASSACFIIPSQLKQDQIATFDIKLPVPAQPGSQLRFSYKYQNSEDGGGNRQSFDVEVPKGE